MANRRDMALPQLLELLERLDPHYALLLREFHEAIEGLDQLSSRLSMLCTIGTAAAAASEAQLDHYLREATGANLTPEEALEPVLYTMSFAGYQPLARGIAVFVGVFGEDAVRGQRSEDYPEGESIDGYDGPGLEVGTEMYGPMRARMNIDNFRSIGREFANALERYAYAGVFRRRVLTPLERELTSVAMLSALEKPGPFVWHAKAALRLGATPDQLKYSVVKQIPISGVLRAFAALRLLADVVTDWRAHPGSDQI